MEKTERKKNEKIKDEKRKKGTSRWEQIGTCSLLFRKQKSKVGFSFFGGENHVHSAEILEVIDLQLGGLGGLQ